MINSRSFISITVISVLAVACSSNDSKKEEQVANQTQSEYSVTESKGNTSVGSSSKQLASAPVDSFQLESRIIPSGPGYGYEIYSQGHKMIVQLTIPAVQGNQYFKTEDRAGKAAELVMNKIRNNVMPPAVSIQELDSIGVLN